MNAAVAEPEEIHIGPQEGPQTEFLSTTADIAVYGGSAGGGKSYGLLLEPLRHFTNPEFGAIIFRRNNTMIRNQGGLWDESYKLYIKMGAHPRESFLEWVFPYDWTLKFAHLENENTVYNYQGAQIPFIGFDELTHFSETQFFYMMSRNRSMSGVPGYIRATCNPDKDSWVRKLIDWYIGPDGYVVPDRAGVIRWFIRIDDKIIWADSREEIIDQYGPDEIPKSFTFIPAKLSDNKILMQKDPSYLGSLRALSRVERLRLLGGNWDVRAIAGTLFRREWFPVIKVIPAGWIRCVRFWDRAATKPNEVNKDPDYTRGLKMYQYPNGSFLVADIKSMRDTPGKVEGLIKNVASHDGYDVEIISQQDPGSAGVSEAHHFITMLVGYIVSTVVISKDKVTRAKAVSAQCEGGNVFVLEADWNEEFFSELEMFPSDDAHDDQVDVLSGAFNTLALEASMFDNL